MTVPTITALPEIPAYSDANFETKAPAVLSALRNTFIAEMNAAIAAINAYNYGAAVNANIITGQVAVANGGTGLSELAAGRIPYGNAANPLDSSENLTYAEGLLIAKRASLSALRLINTNNNYDTDPTVTESVLTMRRAGKSGYSFDSGVEFGIGRYEVSSLNARTQFDIRLAHTASLADITVMSLRSNGNVGIGTTAPTKKLEVTDATGAQARLTHSAGNYTDFKTDGDGNLSFSPTGDDDLTGVRFKRRQRIVTSSVGDGSTATATFSQLFDIIGSEGGRILIFVRRSSSVRNDAGMRTYAFYRFTEGGANNQASVAALHSALVQPSGIPGGTITDITATIGGTNVRDLTVTITTATTSTYEVSVIIEGDRGGDRY